MMDTSQGVTAILPALLKARKAIGRGIVKNATGHGYKYADLASLLDAIEGPFNDAGILELTSQLSADMVVCRIYHAESGEWVEVTAAVSAAGEEARKGGPKGAQAAGSAFTYARRYCLMAMLGMAAEDDDGRATRRDQREPPRGNGGSNIERLERAMIDPAKAQAFATAGGHGRIEDWAPMSIERFIADVAAGKVTL